MTEEELSTNIINSQNCDNASSSSSSPSSSSSGDCCLDVYKISDNQIFIGSTMTNEESCDEYKNLTTNDNEIEQTKRESDVTDWKKKREDFLNSIKTVKQSSREINSEENEFKNVMTS
ncbi:hypothetical protein Phum_PHUM492250 [Pediculus humanus corporis]|uniref:Uncharacterized protein n=1 Tax=Pediculus humanus subsp. corporis TaxID=121224 RepID=E0VWZ0_PEDHC|nr:uncharacterized protein Phum_PHUM492250 [Pediculus humanus corporis]EEB17896.1 hypothetical protein Phum_PHUM492250 [Pediculus humanus corporis]